MKKNIKAPAFSVIMPVYNKEKYIERAVKSVLNQTYKNFEIIIVDDKSTDNSLNIIKKFKDKRIRIFKHRKNKGASGARNFGIKKAKAPYIAFLDADDEYMPDFLQEIVRLQNKYKKILFFATAFKFVDVTGTEFHNGFGNKKDFLIKNVMLKMINDKFFFHVSSIVVHKKIFEDVGAFQSSYKGKKINNVMCEDSDLFLRISDKYMLAYSNADGCIYYRNISNSATNNARRDINLDYQFYENTLFKLMAEAKNVYRKKSLQKLLNQLYEKLAVRFIVRGQYKKAEEILYKSDKKSSSFHKIKNIIKKSEILNNISQKNHG